MAVGYGAGSYLVRVHLFTVKVEYHQCCELLRVVCECVAKYYRESKVLSGENTFLCVSVIHTQSCSIDGDCKQNAISKLL